MVESQNYTVRFIKREEVAKDTYSFYFTRPEGFEFSAGQYNRWILPIEATDGRGSARFFTISSSSTDNEFLMITTKIIQSDFKKALLQLKEQDEIRIFGPLGKFVLDEHDTSERVLLAGGIGITPYHSMLRYAGAVNLKLPLTLIVSFSTPEEMVFYDELTQLAKEHPNVQVVYTITKPEDSQTPWHGEQGRISAELIKKYTKNIAAAKFYLVGPPPMVEGTRTLLLDMNIPIEQITIEQFTGY